MRAVRCVVVAVGVGGNVSWCMCVVSGLEGGGVVRVRVLLSYFILFL
jgi:hypothetical protein